MKNEKMYVAIVDDGRDRHSFSYYSAYKNGSHNNKDDCLAAWRRHHKSRVTIVSIRTVADGEDPYLSVY